MLIKNVNLKLVEFKCLAEMFKPIHSNATGLLGHKSFADYFAHIVPLVKPILTGFHIEFRMFMPYFGAKQ